MKLMDVSTKKYPNTFVMVDDEDFDFLSQWKWYPRNCARKPYTNIYVVRTRSRRDQKSGFITMHKVIMNTPSGMHTDHINGDHFDNRRSNLRICTPRQNIMNQAKAKFGRKLTSVYKGVDWKKSRGMWRASIKSEGKSYDVGYFKDEKMAARAYNAAAKIYHGNFARLNEIKP